MVDAGSQLPPLVKRYTTLASLLDILAERRITLLSPSSWSDKNDAQFIRIYEETLSDASVLALCCTATKSERSNYWDTFGPTMEGVCVEFERVGLQRALHSGGATFGRVRYQTIDKIRAFEADSIEELAFLKRYAYRNEAEWRAIKICKGLGLLSDTIPIPIEIVKRVILSPRMPKAAAQSVKGIIQSIPGCERLSVRPSTIYISTTWQGEGRRIADAVRLRK